eukprot:m.108022 g.108022  ORF g.108022 m.108022 type:complete len:481 (-) comp15202_c3_seq1:32-1474(-)
MRAAVLALLCICLLAASHAEQQRAADGSRPHDAAATQHVAASTGNTEHSSDIGMNTDALDVLTRAPGMWTEPLNVDPPLRRYKMGICLSIPAETTSMYTNGAKQASFFLYELLTFRDRHSVVLINLDKGDPSAQPEWRLDGIQVVRYEEALEMDLDIVVELGMQMRQDQVDRLQLKGTKVAAYRSGNNYVMTMENMLYNRSTSTMFETVGYDIVWTLPSFNRSNAFLSMIYQTNVKVAPYLWSPRYFEHVAQQIKTRQYYEPREGPKSVAVFEPNLNIVKTATMPMVISELLYRSDPDVIGKVYITNSGELSKDPDFIRFVQSAMTIYQGKKMYFEKRYRFAWFLSLYTDVVLSHQWGNELNYLYIEALFAGYPLVHNSPYFKDCGYYYEGDDAYMGRDKLREALLEHDANMEAYNAKAKECVWRHSPVNPANIYEWDALLNELYETERSEFHQQRLLNSPSNTQAQHQQQEKQEQPQTN